MPTGLQESITATELPQAKSDLCVLVALSFHCLHLEVLAILHKGSLITRIPKTKLHSILASYVITADPSTFSPTHLVTYGLLCNKCLLTTDNICVCLATFSRSCSHDR